MLKKNSYPASAAECTVLFHWL